MGKHTLFIANTIRLICWNYIQYKTNWISKLKSIQNVTSQLSKKNVLYLKIIQSLATNGALFDKQQMEYLKN